MLYYFIIVVVVITIIIISGGIVIVSMWAKFRPVIQNPPDVQSIRDQSLSMRLGLFLCLKQI